MEQKMPKVVINGRTLRNFSTALEAVKLQARVQSTRGPPPLGVSTYFKYIIGADRDFNADQLQEAVANNTLEQATAIDGRVGQYGANGVLYPYPIGTSYLPVGVKDIVRQQGAGRLQELLTNSGDFSGEVLVTKEKALQLLRDSHNKADRASAEAAFQQVDGYYDACATLLLEQFDKTLATRSRNLNLLSNGEFDTRRTLGYQRLNMVLRVVRDTYVTCNNGTLPVVKEWYTLKQRPGQSLQSYFSYYTELMDKKRFLNLDGPVADALLRFRLGLIDTVGGELAELALHRRQQVPDALAIIEEMKYGARDQRGSNLGGGSGSANEGAIKRGAGGAADAGSSARKFKKGHDGARHQAGPNEDQAKHNQDTNPKKPGKKSWKSKDQPNNNKVSAEERERRRKAGACFECGEQGHYGRDCPSKSSGGGGGAGPATKASGGSEAILGWFPRLFRDDFLPPEAVADVYRLRAHWPVERGELRLAGSLLPNQ